MNKRKALLLVLYTLTLAAALWYPVGRIISVEFPSVEPVELKFRATVQDPYDPMRGRYVALRVMPDEVPTADKKSRFHYHESGYAVIAGDDKGFARIVRLTKAADALRPGEIAVKLKRIWYYKPYDKKSAKYKIVYPFDRFYLNELKAPDLEAELQNRREAVILKVKLFPGGGSVVSGLSR